MTSHGHSNLTIVSRNNQLEKESDLFSLQRNPVKMSHYMKLNLTIDVPRNHMRPPKGEEGLWA